KDNLLKMLEATAEKLKVQPGEPVVAPTCQAASPVTGPKEILLHLASRADHKGSWGEFPSENWITLKEAEWKTWLPPTAKAGATYAISEKEAGKVLTYFFPQTEICNFDKMIEPDGPYKHRIDSISLKGKVLSVQDDVVKVRLDGMVKIHHNFYPK